MMEPDCDSDAVMRKVSDSLPIGVLVPELRAGIGCQYG